jgi:hypothetical protein
MLKKISLRELIYVIRPSLRNSYPFADWYVLANTIAAFVFLFLSFPEKMAPWEWLLIIYAAFRIFEILVYIIWLLLFQGYSEDEDASIPLASYRRTVLLLLFNYAEVVLWFSLILQRKVG